MKTLTTPKAIIISRIVIALSVVLSSFITSHWLNEVDKSLSDLYWIVNNSLGDIKRELSNIALRIDYLNQ